MNSTTLLWYGTTLVWWGSILLCHTSVTMIAIVMLKFYWRVPQKNTMRKLEYLKINYALIFFIHKPCPPSISWRGNNNMYNLVLLINLINIKENNSNYNVYIYIIIYIYAYNIYIYIFPADKYKLYCLPQQQHLITYSLFASCPLPYTQTSIQTREKNYNKKTYIWG